MNVKYLKHWFTPLMMAFAMTLFYACSSDDEEEDNPKVVPPSNTVGQINGYMYVELAGIKWATENVGECGITAAAGPGANGNNWGCYYYTQDNARKTAESWGGTWQLPTEEHWQKLLDECDWAWQDSYYFDGETMSGYIVSEKKDSTRFIFLPAAGFYVDGKDIVIDQGGYGYSWSSDKERYLYFYAGYRRMTNFSTYYGLAVRLVSE